MYEKLSLEGESRCGDVHLIRGIKDLGRLDSAHLMQLTGKEHFLLGQKKALEHAKGVKVPTDTFSVAAAGREKKKIFHIELCFSTERKSKFLQRDFLKRCGGYFFRSAKNLHSIFLPSQGLLAFSSYLDYTAYN